MKSTGTPSTLCILWVERQRILLIWLSFPVAIKMTINGTPLAVEHVQQIEEERKLGDDIINKLMQNPEFKEILFQKVKAMGYDKVM